MLCRKSDHHLNALQRGNRTKRPTAQSRRPGQWLVPRAHRGDSLAPSSNGWLHYLKLLTAVVWYEKSNRMEIGDVDGCDRVP